MRGKGGRKKCAEKSAEKRRTKKNTPRNKKKCTKLKNASKSTPVQRNDVICFCQNPRSEAQLLRLPGPKSEGGDDLGRFSISVVLLFLFPTFFNFLFRICFRQFVVRIWFGEVFSCTLLKTFWPENRRSVKTAFKRVLNTAQERAQNEPMKENILFS